MARAWSADLIAAMKADVIRLRFLLELETDEGWLRATDNGAQLTYDSKTFEAARDKWRIEGELSTGAMLVPETVTISFDGGDQYDNASIIGRLLDRTWHRRQVVLIGILLNVETGAILDDFDTWRGRMDQVSTSESEAAAGIVTISCESGTFNALSRNQATVSDADQRRRSATDAFLKNQASKVNIKMPFGLSNSKVPGVTGTGGSSGGPSDSFSSPGLSRF